MSTKLHLEISSREPKTYFASGDKCSELNEKKEIHTLYIKTIEDGKNYRDQFTLNRKNNLHKVISNSFSDMTQNKNKRPNSQVIHDLVYQEQGWIPLQEISKTPSTANKDRLKSEYCLERERIYYSIACKSSKSFEQKHTSEDLKPVQKDNWVSEGKESVKLSDLKTTK